LKKRTDTGKGNRGREGEKRNVDAVTWRRLDNKKPHNYEEKIPSTEGAGEGT